LRFKECDKKTGVGDEQPKYVIKTAATAKQHGLGNRAGLYRHAHALELFLGTQRNVRAALEKIIERAGEVEVNAAAVVSAVDAYARINPAGSGLSDRSTSI